MDSLAARCALRPISRLRRQETGIELTVRRFDPRPHRRDLLSTTHPVFPSQHKVILACGCSGIDILTQPASWRGEDAQSSVMMTSCR